MEFGIFDSFLDPIIIVNSNGDIRYINSMTTRWLTLVDDFGVVGDNISKFVEFSESPALTTMATLVEYQHSNYHLTHFKLLSKQYESFAKICVLRLPDENEVALYAIIIRDREFIKALIDEDDFKLKSTKEKNGGGIVKHENLKGIVENIKTDTNVLSEESIVKAIPKERRAKFESVANLIFVDIAKAVVGNAVLISDDWIDIVIKKVPNLRIDMKVNIEVAGNVKMRGFSSVGVLKEVGSIGSDLLIKISFGSLSALSRRALDEYIEVNMLKL